MLSLNVQKVTKNYGKTVAVRDMSFVLQPGVYGIIGPNGAGKSTLLQMITTNLTQYEGTISYCGDEIKKMGSTYRNNNGIRRFYCEAVFVLYGSTKRNKERGSGTKDKGIKQYT